ncbi:Autolysin [Collinsella aerofaciens]|uniref:Autolysin n=1 Tax=Collinsella aerofaciens TaxID=74426 RepID=A0A5K1IRZ2_9ACTN|nr:GH25 family lysozyme [Collinsella aerofaciens]VWL91282.1 Autolysin [Collinsella aerofaciens]
MKRLKCCVALFLSLVFGFSGVLQPFALYAETLDLAQEQPKVSQPANESTSSNVSADASGDQMESDSAAQDSSAPDSSEASDAESASADAATDEVSDEASDDDIEAPLAENSWRYVDGSLRSDLPDDYGANADFDGRAMHSMPKGATAQGIDVSEHNGTVDWQSVKDAGIDFAILRVCFAGDTNGGRLDYFFRRNVSECERLGIPYGVYLYSYARNEDDAQAEARLMLGALKGHSPTLPVYYDLEEQKTNADGSPKWTPFNDPSKLASIAKTFCGQIAAAGYKPGIYANVNWFKNYLTDPCFLSSGWSIWTAQYWYGGRYDECLGLTPEAPAKYDCWQYSARGSVPGVSGDVDVSYWFGAGLGDHWQETDEGKYYVSSNGQPYKGWKLISGLWYWFDPAKGGAMATGPAEVEGTWYVFSSSGSLSNGWVRKDGEWYYGASGGKMVRGWVKGSAWYYTDPESGRMLTGAVEIDGKSYWLDPANGGACARSAWVEMPEGFLSYAANDGVLCMAVKDGVLYKDATFTDVLSGWVDCGDDRLYADSQGHVLTGWQRIAGNWYLFDSNGIMHRGWCWNGYAYYYLDKSNGNMRTGWVSDLGSWYWLDPDNGGAMAIGWIKVGQNWYYLNPNNGGRMVTGPLMIDGYIRTFNSDGSCIC